MNKKFKRLLEPNVRFYFMFLILFTVVNFFVSGHNQLIAIIEAVIIVALYIYSRISAPKRNREILKYIETMSHEKDATEKNTFANFPLPMVVFNLNDGKVISSNESFRSLAGVSDKEHFFQHRISDIAPEFSTKWLLEGKFECPVIVTVGSRSYRVYGNIVRSEKNTGFGNYMASTYWVDVTEYAHISDEFQLSRPVFAIIMLDNYDELTKNATEKDKSSIMASIDDKISEWTGKCEGYLCKYDRDRYVFVFEERFLQDFVDAKFSILDSVKSIVTTGGIAATVSIGIGKDGESIQESYQFAALSIEMALSRGGDQVVIKNRFNFEFYGGKSSQTEKHTKVKSRVMANSMTRLMSDASTIFVMGHKYADLDSVGAAIGICCIARKMGKSVYVVVDREENVSKTLIERMETLPEYEGVFISAEDAILKADVNSLLVIVDTNRPEQVESETLLLSCNRVALIDHHRRAATYIQNAALNFHEPYASSTCELITELLQYIVEQSDIMRLEAEALFSGIVLDTKSFTLRTGGRTFEAAAFLRRAGADTAEVKRFLQSDFKTAIQRYNIIQKAKVYKEGIAIAAPDTVQNRVIAAQAADELLNIAGIRASFVIYPENDSVSISARSIGDINVQLIVEKLGGGGNKATAGAQIHGKSMKEVVTDLLNAIDHYLEVYES